MNVRKFFSASLILGAIMASSVSVAKAEAAPNNTFSPEQTKQIENIIHDYLLKNPTILVKVSNQLRQNEQAEMQKRALASLSNNAAELLRSEAPTAGNPKGDVTVVEFFDARCPHCKRMTDTVHALIKQDPQVRVVFKEFPIFGGDSLLAAKAALASVKQGKYYAFHQALMNTKSTLDEPKIMSIAKQVGLDIEKLKKDMADESINKQLKSNFELAKSMGVQFTPVFIVAKTNGTNQQGASFIPGATNLEQLQASVNKAREH